MTSVIVNSTEVSLFSLFGSIPSNVKVVLSFAASSTAYLPFVQNGYVHYRLNGFSQADAKSFSKQYLSTYLKLCLHSKKIFLARGC